MRGDTHFLGGGKSQSMMKSKHTNFMLFFWDGIARIYGFNNIQAENWLNSLLVPKVWL